MSEEPQYPKLREFLRKTKVSDVILAKGDSLLTFDENSSLLDVLKGLKSRELLSGPVLKDGKFVGFVDCLDLVTVASVLEAAKPIVESLAKKEIEVETFTAQENEVFAAQKAIEVVNASERNTSSVVSITDSLATLLQVLATTANNTQVHRVAVLDEKKEKFVGIVTQSDLIGFLAIHVIDLPAAACKLSETDVKGQRPAVTVKESDSAMTGFMRMVDLKTTALAVVNDSDELVGCLSASDFKRCPEGNVFTELHESIRAYLTFTSPIADNPSLEPLSVTVDSSFTDALRIMAQHRVHRLFIVEKGQSPKAILSLSDILLWLLVVSKLESGANSSIREMEI